VLVVNKERTLCANLAACLKYPLDHLKENMAVIERSAFLYTSAFFITSNMDALKMYAQYASDNNKPLGFNLSACFLIQFNTDAVNDILKHADYVFCNEDEAKCWAETNKVAHENLTEVAVAIANYAKVNVSRHRIAIITQGKLPVIVAKAEDKSVVEYPVNVLTSDQLVDTNGAGDAFVGGFLSQIVQGKSLEVAIKAGSWLSSQVIQRSGCTFPDTNAFE
jgi:adenosine kinase